MKDFSDKNTHKRKGAAYWIIGMNIISACRYILGYVGIDGFFSEVSVTKNAGERKSVCGCARVLGTASVYISANTAVVIPGTGPHTDDNVVANPLNNAVPLHKIFCTVNICTETTK